MKHQTYNSLELIIKVLSENMYSDMAIVAENYTKKDLINDLTEYQKRVIALMDKAKKVKELYKQTVKHDDA